MLNECFFAEKPSKWLVKRIHLSYCPSDSAFHAASNLPFIYGHVGGHGTNSPQRGVCVQGNDILHEGFWTLTQNKSQCTLITHTEKMAEPLSGLIPILKEIAIKNFRRTPISSNSFSLFVANEYIPGEQHSICDHTDDQNWYASPPIFASVTFFPDGEPESPLETFRFQVFDEEDESWKDMYLPDRSICMMRADIRHRVKPPLQKYRKNAKRRINLTYRNLVDIDIDPFAYLLGVSNHYRYYGVPKEVIIPVDMDIKVIKKVIKRLKKINKYLVVTRVQESSSDRNKQKGCARRALKALYEKKGYDMDHRMLTKSNVVLELLLRSIEYTNDHIPGL